MYLIFWLVEPIFFHFLKQQSTVATIHSTTGTYFSASPSSLLVETSFLSTGNSIILFQVFLFVKTVIENWGSQSLKMKYIPASEHQFFRYFQRF